MRLKELAFLVLLAPAAFSRHVLMDEYRPIWKLVGQRNSDQAIPLLKSLIERDPHFLPAYRSLAEAYAQLNAWTEADNYFLKLASRDPYNGLPYYAIGQLWEARENSAGAAKAYFACIRRSPQVAACYEPYGRVTSEKESITQNELRARIFSARNNLVFDIASSALALYQTQRHPSERIASLAAQKARSADLDEIEAELSAIAGLAAMWNRNGIVGIEFLDRATDLRQKEGDPEAAFAARARSANARSVSDFDRSLAMFEALLQEARNIGHRRWQAEFLYAAGNLHSVRGDHLKGLDYLKAALLLFREDGERALPTMRTYYWIASLYYRLGESDHALQYLEEGMNLATKRAHEAMRAYFAQLLGLIAHAQGNYVKALHYGTIALRCFQAVPMRSQTGIQISNIGKIYADLGEFAIARRSYQQALRISKETEDFNQQERLLSDLGNLYIPNGHAMSAVPYFARSLALFVRTADVPLRETTLVNLGVAELELGQYSAALRHFVEAVALARRLNRKVMIAEALANLGHCYLRLHQNGEATAAFQEAIQIAEPMHLCSPSVQARRGLAEIERQRGDYGAALDELRVAIKTIENMRETAPTGDLRSGLLAQNYPIYQEAIETLATMHARNPENTYDREAFAYAEQGRARSFLDLLAISHVQGDKDLSPELMKKQSELLADLEKASAALMKEDSPANRRALNGAEDRFSAWTSKVRATNPRFQELRYPDPVSATAVQQGIAGGRIALLEYEIGEQRSFVWFISENRFRMEQLPGRVAIAAEVGALRKAINHAPKAFEEDYTRQARRLYQILVQPVAASLRNGQALIIIPDGILHYVPFELLSGERPLIEDFTIGYAPSSSALLSLLASTSRRERPPRDLLAFGDPTYTPIIGSSKGQSAADRVRGVYQRGGISFASLPNTRDEVLAIAQLYPSSRRQIYLGPEATAARLKEEKLTDYQHLHFATHAIVDERVPARSGIVLSPSRVKNDDGILRMPDIFNLKLNADLVVLSACQTGLGRLVRGEGMVGLTRAFLYAGTPRVAVSLWEVNDVATADFMRLFYQYMQAGESPGAALRSAKLSMVRARVRAYRNPYYWAPFVLVGVP